MYEHTLIGIKPDAFTPLMERDESNALRIPLPDSIDILIGEIRDLIHSHTLSLVEERRYLMSTEIAKLHYEEHLWVWDHNHNMDKWEFLVWYMTSWPSHWFHVTGESAIQKGRTIITLLREKYLVNPKARYNMTHASDSQTSSSREISLHFPKSSIE